MAVTSTSVGAKNLLFVEYECRMLAQRNSFEFNLFCKPLSEWAIFGSNLKNRPLLFEAYQTKSDELLRVGRVAIKLLNLKVFAPKVSLSIFRYFVFCCCYYLFKHIVVRSQTS